MTVCKEPAVDWDDAACTVPARTVDEELDDQRAWYIAGALTRAVTDISGHFTDTAPVTWGEPLIEEACAGQVKTGIIAVPFLQLTTPCFNPRSYEWRVVVTWKAATTAQTVAGDVEHLRRRLTEHACCLLNHFGIRGRLSVASILNQPAGAQVAQAIITIQAT
jgi:hypothetical protein